MADLTVEQITDPKQQHIKADVFPLMLRASYSAHMAAVLDWAAANSQTLQTQLASHGAIMLRGFGLTDSDDFDALVRALGVTNFTYAESLSNAVRRNRTERVFTANEAPPSVSIYLHHEMAQTPVYPSRLMFFCEQAAESGGATPICRSDVLLSQLRQRCPAFVAACETLGVRYSQSMPAEDDLNSGQGRSWRSTLSVANRQQAELRLTKLGYQWVWQTADALRVTTPVLPAVRTTKTGVKVFFNQLIAAYRGWQDVRNESEKSIFFGDGSAIDVDAMATAIALADELTFDIPWQSGDVAVLDNFLVMHGRRTFSGERRVLASLIA